MAKEKAVVPEHAQEFTIESPELTEAELKGLIPKAISNGKKKEKVQALFAKERVLTESSDAARDLYAQGRYGVVLEDGKIHLSLHEALYLLEKKKVIIKDYRNKQLTFAQFLRRAKRIEPEFWIRYSVFKDMRSRGYIVKTALKFGADFRVYDRGVKPGEDHARWVVYPVHEGSTLTWYEFAAKNRVAHSTKKRLLIGVVDDEGDVSYWEIKWMRP
ncbi:tRNA-intron lyase [Candidatus Woesearchaeota archaeon]|nr:tRNA-intron lyase [Candidatus Woesearchaeota archaeon]